MNDHVRLLFVGSLEGGTLTQMLLHLVLMLELLLELLLEMEGLMVLR